MIVQGGCTRCGYTVFHDGSDAGDVWALLAHRCPGDARPAGREGGRSRRPHTPPRHTITIIRTTRKLIRP